MSIVLHHHSSMPINPWATTVGNHCLLTDVVSQSFHIGIRANPSSASPGYNGDGFDGGRNMAILRYIGARQADPRTTQDVSQNPLIEAKLVVRSSALLVGLHLTDTNCLAMGPRKSGSFTCPIVYSAPLLISAAARTSRCRWRGHQH